MLGTPVGSRGFVREKVKEKVEKIRHITGKLPLLRDPHSEFVLLRSCLSLPKVMFLLRTLDLSDSVDLMQSFDQITRGALVNILGHPVTDIQWCQAKLPVSMGGAGLIAAEDHFSVAHATSLLSSQQLIQGLLGRPEDDAQPSLPQPILDSISAKQGEEVTAESLYGVSQKAASLKVDQLNHTSLLNHFSEEGDDRETARMMSLGLPCAGSWLSVTPSPPLGLHLRPSEFVPCLRYRLGVPVFSTDGPCLLAPNPVTEWETTLLAAPNEGTALAGTTS